ncbi:Na+/H+ antiporter subunit E [Symbioplanes lichenis]|uniref:Na+/H+ antiporter subunit E n=1 Tax=Symbioplanes lichenis TaxID=1629072 RepID=UPI00273A3CD7|nr:Na+/H+ antiporter subunit E [Actinoplanes lichenis]
MRARAVAAAGLTVIWMLLWGSFTPLTLVGGAVIAVIVLAVFPLPVVTHTGGVHPLGVLRFAGRFAVDLVVSSVQVAVLAFRFGHIPRSAIIAVPLRAPSDLGLTLTAEALSLVPGSLVVEVDRSLGVLYVHVLGVPDAAAADRYRRSVLDLEDRLIRAFGRPA